MTNDRILLTADRSEPYAKLVEDLRHARSLCDQDPQQGALAFVRAAVTFIQAITDPAEDLAAPGAALINAFEGLKGGKGSPIFQRKRFGNVPPSSAGNHLFRAEAAACMEVLIQLGDTADQAARTIADHFAKAGQASVTPEAVTKWRKRYRIALQHGRLKPAESAADLDAVRYQRLCESLAAGSNTDRDAHRQTVLSALISMIKVRIGS